MENIFYWLITFIMYALRIIGAIFYILWKFHPNPIIEKGHRNGYYYPEWDYKLWRWVFVGVKPMDDPNRFKLNK